jgi:hypothetical protein
MKTPFVEVTCEHGIATVVCVLCRAWEFVAEQSAEGDRRVRERVEAHLKFAHGAAHA